MSKPKFNPNEAAAKMFLSTQQAQDTQDTHENAHDTQGTQRKQKLPRINLAFYGDNLEYAREAAWKARKTITQYVNDLIEEDKRKSRS